MRFSHGLKRKHSATHASHQLTRTAKRLRIVLRTHTQYRGRPTKSTRVHMQRYEWRGRRRGRIRRGSGGEEAWHRGEERCRGEERNDTEEAWHRGEVRGEVWRRGVVVTRGVAATRGATRRGAASTRGGAAWTGGAAAVEKADRHLEERCGAEERWRARRRREEARGELRRREKRRRDSNMARERRRERTATAAHWRQVFA